MIEDEEDQWFAEQMVTFFSEDVEERPKIDTGSSSALSEESSHHDPSSSSVQDSYLSHGDSEDDDDDDILMEALAGLKRSQPLKMFEAFAVLKAVAQDDPRVGLPTRSYASPLVPSRGMYYVVRRKSSVGGDGVEKPKKLHNSPDAVKVAFQSVLNAEAWWDGDVGVVSRPMSRGFRGESGGDHGYRGRMYTLVARSGEGRLPSKRRRGCNDTNGGGQPAAFSAVDVSLVHAWRATAEDSATSSFSPGDLFASPPRGAGGLVKRNEKSSGTNVAASRPAMWCDESTGDLHVRGNLRVDGKIYGQLATEPFAADYAEWFMCEGKVPKAGSVVQLRSPEQKLSMKTSGPGPVLIVSTKPAIAAGVPTAPSIAKKGALVAFLGQVPVRCRGRVNCGDQLVASGDDDGCAVSLEELLISTEKCRRDTMKRIDNLGVAMEMSSGEEEEETLLCFVRWNHAVRREIDDVINEAVTYVQSTWQRSLVDLITVISAIAIIVDVTLVVVTCFAIQNNNSNPRNQAAYAVLVQTIGFTNFCLIILLFVSFARKGHKHELKQFRGVVVFWMLAVAVACAAVAVLGRGDDKKQNFNLRTLIIFMVWKGYNISYNIYLIHVMSHFRATRTYSDRVKNIFSDLKRVASGICLEDSSPVASQEETKYETENDAAEKQICAEAVVVKGEELA